MAYTIVKSDGTVLTTIADGTINTTSTSLGLPGRNYAGYGQSLDTNFVHILENFADNAPPANPLRGQLWFNTNDTTLYVCPTDGESNSQAWLALTATSSGGNTSFGGVTVTGNVSSNNLTVTNQIQSANGVFTNISVSSNANIGNSTIDTANVGNLNTQSISTGGLSTSGALTGVWIANGGGVANGVAGTSLYITGGNLVVSNTSSRGVVADNYYYSNGNSIFGGGIAYSNANVTNFLPTYAGIFGSNSIAATFRGSTLTTGSASNAGSITGNWILTANSRLNATYADLAERFESDTEYEPGTVVEIGGEAEITAVKYELSEDVFGVISDTAAYLMNAGAGDDKTHPPVAVSGRVAVKVKGKVLKGQRLVSAGNGIARAAKDGEANAFNTIGRALEDKLTKGLGTVEAIVMIR